jgi:hypothetical protein
VVHLAHVAGLDDQADLVRVFSRTRWWCTAEVSSSDGIGARSKSESRSDSTMKRAPFGDGLGDLGADLVQRSAPGLCAAAVDVVQALTRGREAGQVAVAVDVDDLGQLVVVEDRERQHDLRQCAGVGSSRLPSGPIGLLSEVTSSSRMASSGGLVTWANSWVK